MGRTPRLERESDSAVPGGDAFPAQLERPPAALAIACNGGGVPGALDRGDDRRRVAREGIGERLDGSADDVLEDALRARQLAVDLCGCRAGEIAMLEGVRADLDEGEARDRAELVLRHEPHLRRGVQPGVGPAEQAGADEEGRGHAEGFEEGGQDRCVVLGAVVEREGADPTRRSAAAQTAGELGDGHELVSAGEEPLDLAAEPGFRDGEVARVVLTGHGPEAVVHEQERRAHRVGHSRLVDSGLRSPDVQSDTSIRPGTRTPRSSSPRGRR